MENGDEMITNLETYNPFEDAGGDKYEKIVAATRVDIRVHQRTNYKKTTICEGLPVEINYNRVLRALKKNFSCNGAIKKTRQHGNVIQLQGDFHNELIEFFTETGLCDRKNIKLHGV